MARRNLLACLILAGCVPGVPVVIHSKPIIEVQTITIVKVERQHIAADRLVCPADPPLPYPPTQQAIGVYMANLRGAADQCRANLMALAPKPPK
jgi:hypothetical protein